MSIAPLSQLAQPSTLASISEGCKIVKAAIHRNDDKIAKLLDMVVTPA